MNGVQFLEKVREISPESVRIMLTGNVDLETAIEAVNKGEIFHFLMKPCRIETLSKALELAVKKYNKVVRLLTESITDELTGLYNRRYFEHNLDEKLNKPGKVFSITNIDVNDFKKINDNMGHEKGDEALKILAEVFLKVKRNYDLVARTGGDEFMVLSELTPKSGAEVMVKRIREMLNEKTIDSGSGLKLKISAGIATYPEDGRDRITLMKVSDEAMYLDKKGQKAGR